MSSFLETLKERIVVFDGAMGTNLQVQNLSLEDFGGLRFEGCNENLLITRPDAVENVHTAFLDVGCDVIETNSFNGTPVDFAEYDMADQTYDMNVRAATLAKRVASDYSTKDKPRWVAGSMGPGRKLPTLGHISFLDLKAAYAEQVRGLLDGGVDLLIVETCQDLLQTKAALERDLRLVRCEDGRLEIALEPNASKALVGELGRKLSQWTGRRWMVVVSAEQGQPTIRAQQDVRRVALENDVRSDPLVQAVLAKYPGAEIVAVRTPDTSEAAGAGEVAPLDDAPDYPPYDDDDPEGMTDA